MQKDQKGTSSSDKASLLSSQRASSSPSERAPSSPSLRASRVSSQRASTSPCQKASSSPSERAPSSPSQRASAFELPEERLATTDIDGERVYLYPADVKGRFRRLRTIVYWALICIFLCLPWISVNGTPLIFLDILNRRFILFGIQFWAHEAPILFLVFLTFVLTIGFITALVGRVWCGWACPQTVFVDGIFQRIESFLEGKGKARQRFDARPMTPKKIGIKALKWSLFGLASLVITHSFLAYFIGAEGVLKAIQQSPSHHYLSFITIVVTTVIIMFDFGWFREQFCIIACPYGRLQSVLMDEHSLVVGYDSKRGEPRKQDRHDTSSTGDCINCYRCVQVCPTGIDIRRGTQMECIMCTACIDACDQVMDKLNKPKGLVRYDSEQRLSGKPATFLRPRVAVYVVLWVVSVTLLSFALSHRDMVPVFVKRASNPPYTKLADNNIQNQFSFSVQNQFFVPINVSFFLPQALKNLGITLIQPQDVWTLAPGKKQQIPLFIRFPKDMLERGTTVISISKQIKKDGQLMNHEQEVVLIGS